MEFPNLLSKGYMARLYTRYVLSDGQHGLSNMSDKILLFAAILHKISICKRGDQYLIVPGTTVFANTKGKWVGCFANTGLGSRFSK